MGRVRAITNRFRALVIAALVIIGCLAGPARGGTEIFVSIGSGEMDGVYYPVVKAICRVIFRELRDQGIWCSPETTPGSVYNIDRVETGELEFGIAQSDLQSDAYGGTGRWRGKPVSDLRSVLSLYPELVTIIARRGANIHSLTDLAGKRVNAGGEGTGTRATWEALAHAIDPQQPTQLSDLRPDDAIAALCDGSIDAQLFIVGHPSDLVAKQLAACPSDFVAIAGSVIDTLISAHRYYARGQIPTDLYGIGGTIPSFGSRATLVTSASADPRVVAAVSRAIMTHMAELRAAHPALSKLKAKEMVTESLTAPLHPAAASVYEDLGLLK